MAYRRHIHASEILVPEGHGSQATALLEEILRAHAEQAQAQGQPYFERSGGSFFFRLP